MTMLIRRTLNAVIPILVVLTTTASIAAAQPARKPRPIRVAPGMSPQLQGDLKPGQTVKFAIKVVVPGGLLEIAHIKSAVKYHIEIVNSKDEVLAEWRREGRGMGDSPREKRKVELEAGDYTVKFSALDADGEGHFMLFLRMEPKRSVISLLPLRLGPGMSRELQGDLMPGQTVKFAIRVVEPGGSLVIEFIKSAVRYHIEIVDSQNNLIADWRREGQGMGDFPGEPRPQLDAGDYTLKFSALDGEGQGHFMLFVRLQPKGSVSSTSPAN
jgi:hypothetical protein